MALIAAAGDIVLILGLLVAIGAIELLVRVIRPVAAHLNFDLPLGLGAIHLGDAIMGTVVAGLQAEQDALGWRTAQLEQGLADMLGWLASGASSIGAAILDALRYVWQHGIERLVHAVTNPIQALVAEVSAKVSLVRADLAHDYAALQGYADAAATRAISDATAYADSAVRSASTALTGDLLREVARVEGEIGSAARAAGKHANEAVASLRKAETGAIQSATTMAQDAQVAIGQAEQYAIKTAETDAERALVASQAAAAQALADVKAVAVTWEHDLGSLKIPQTVAGAAGLIAALPALSTLVHTIATETGLDKSQCRQKMKGVCEANATSWFGLVEGMAVAEIPLSLTAVVDAAKYMFTTAADIVKTAASV